MTDGEADMGSGSPEEASFAQRNRLVLLTGLALALALWLLYEVGEKGLLGEPTAERSSVERIAWQLLPDGSQFAISASPVVSSSSSMTEHRSAMRCWPQDNQFSCVSITKSSGALSALNVSSYSTDDLPGYLLPIFDQDGYTCSTVLGSPQESIGNGSATLTSNQLRSLDDRWSRKFVTRFMAENRVKGQWFDCLTVLREVSSGSLETLGTTLITKSVLP